jgi:predicted phosphodiesterase
MKRILTIGDVHGRTCWESIADINILVDTPNLDTDYDLYIFIGDYTDSFTETSLTILNNLKRLIQFKDNYPDKVILLLGNHDLQYLYEYEGHGCSGFRPTAYFDLHELFTRNKDKFQVAFQLDKFIWTHAGLHKGWYEFEFPFQSERIADDLNGALKQNVRSLFDCSFHRGGFKRAGGPFWADKQETSKKPIEGYHQIIGHTATDSIKVMKHPKSNVYQLFYVDALEHGEALELRIGKHEFAYEIIKFEVQDSYLDLSTIDWIDDE